MIFFCVGHIGKYHVFFKVIYGDEEEVELFGSLFLSGLEQMVRCVTFVSFRGVSVVIVDVAAKTKISPCFNPLRRRLDSFRPVTRVGPRVAERSFDRVFKDEYLARSLPRIVDP